MEKNKQTVYTLEFQSEAVKLVLVQGLSISAAATRLNLAKSTLAHWVNRAKHSKHASIPGARSVAELETEIAKLRKALSEAQMERDILKKATAYFAKESHKGTRI